MTRQAATDPIAAWLLPAEQRLRRVELPPELLDELRARVRLEVVGPYVGPGDAVVRVMPPRWFLADTIEITEDVAHAFELRAIDVSNLGQTKPGRTLPGTACTPSAPLRPFDWCSPQMPIVIKITNVSSEPAAFRCALVGEEVLPHSYETDPSRDDARRLRHRLNDHAADVEELAANAEILFGAAGDATRVRWLQLERGGYGGIGKSSALHETLGLSADDRLVVHVLAYRVQRGQIVAGNELTGRSFNHFFVESLHDLVQAAGRARSGQGVPLRLDFGRPSSVNYLDGATFPTDVFERVVLGFRATLHLQIGALLGT